MIKVTITADVRCDTLQEVAVSKNKLEDVGFQIHLTLDPKHFKATQQQTLTEEEV